MRRGGDQQDVQQSLDADRVQDKPKGSPLALHRDAAQPDADGYQQSQATYIRQLAVRGGMGCRSEQHHGKPEDQAAEQSQ